MRLASLAMYTSPPPLAEATAVLWRFLSDALKQVGLEGVPDKLDTSVRYNEAWTHPDLLLAQTCGFPYVKHLRGKVRLVATPVYGHPGCDGPFKCSFIVVAKESDARSLDDLWGLRAAINEPDSNSGVNLLRAAIAPLSRNGRFFSSVIATGGHRNSIAAITAGKADVAAIDCVTYGNVLRFDPGSLAGVRILAETVRGPGLPFITRADASDEEIVLLRQVLRQAITEPLLETARNVLSLKDFAVLSDADYEPLAELERQAQRLGYPAIA
ncbi:phosphate/phosphite/phosphonate ABC transporter substrate-binding protein [Rhizobium herbae]|uniref:ABC-type phosphate/phosphonate transport system substrate-binding protein n=1 Tax=Rhizobium herbae TaxID=508661 RepID=A0ABS4EQJ0_9HYPH|nr:PhnD/SsuA/transferrin family substrate-binding protein [Rhizobium herbae]MBP1860221.1 ABC-type phosphate/phosphonate transport system substrate-binding protein [Rhizobium herbae]